jgi:type I restriction enzyme S subunit
MNEIETKDMKWEMAKLGDLVKISKGKKHNEVFFKQAKFRYVNIEDLHGGNENRFTNENGVFVNSDDVIIAWDGANAGKVGVGINGVIGSTLARLRSTNNAVDSKFLFWFLDSKFNLIKSQRTGATIPHVNGSSLKNLDIPLPPLSTQKRIAAILDKADALRRKEQELLKKYDELAQAIFFEMFGDPVRNVRGFEVIKLGDLFSKSTKCGPFGSAMKKSEFQKNGVPVWVMDNIQNYKFTVENCLFIDEDKYKEMVTYSAINGDIIVSRAGTVGKMCVVDSEFPKSIISTNLILLSLDQWKINPHYFVTIMKYFGTKIGRLKTGSEGAFTHMNTEVLSGLSFPLPPLSAQYRYIEALFNLENQAEKLNKKPESLFQSLLQQSFLEN